MVEIKEGCGRHDKNMGDDDDSPRTVTGHAITKSGTILFTASQRWIENNVKEGKEWQMHNGFGKQFNKGKKNV